MEKYYIIGGIILAAAVIVAAVMISVRSAGNNVIDGPGSVWESYRQITQDEAKEMMKKNDGHIIVDVRRSDEFDEGHIPGAVCIPNESIETERPEELPDLEQIILVYCRSGRRSKEAAQKLFDMGYRNVYEFGGIIDWTGETVKSETDVIDPYYSEPRAVLVIKTESRIFYATLENNSSAKEFVEKLAPGGMTLDMSDYGGFEKVGDLPFTLTENNTEITTVPGDITLYQGDKLSLYYGENTYSLTKLAKIGNVTKEELLEALGDGNAEVGFSLEWSE